MWWLNKIFLFIEPYCFTVLLLKVKNKKEEYNEFSEGIYYYRMYLKTHYFIYIPISLSYIEKQNEIALTKYLDNI